MIGNGSSIAHEVKETNSQLFGVERWFGLAAVPVGETHRFDLMDGVILPFRLTAGASDFGNWVQIIGSEDTPIDAGNIAIDGNRLMVVNTDSVEAFIIQFSFGESAELAANILAGRYTMTPYVSGGPANDSGISDILSVREVIGTKVWARCACVGQTGKIIDMYIGVNETDF